MTIISTEKAPKAIGPYSQAVKVGDFLYTSGQIPIDVNTGNVVEGGVESQTRMVLKNLEAVLKEAGLSLGDVVKATIFIKDMNMFATINEVYGEYFKKPYPARSCVEVARLPKDVLVEIEAVASSK